MFDDLDSARIDGNQLSLFPPTAAQACGEAGIDAALAARLARSGLLSFDPDRCGLLDPAQEAELAFVGALAAAGCDERCIARLLESLPRPYAYSHAKLYYDFQARAWKRLPEPEPRAD